MLMWYLKGTKYFHNHIVHIRFPLQKEKRKVTGTSMEYTGFFQGCYSSRDLNMGVHGGAQPPCNNDRTFKNGYCYNVFLPSLSRDQFLVREKEILRQTMLKHDSAFRDQVRELHRLYRRQKELMDEIGQAELAKQNLILQRSQFSSLSDQRPWQNPGLPWVNLAASRPSISRAKNFQSTLRFSEGKSTRAEGNLEKHRLLHSPHSKSKKKMLDLELPADVYIDSEEEDLYGEEIASKIPELPCYSPKKLPEDSQKSDLKLFTSGDKLNSICHGGSSRPDPFLRRTNDLVDLNEPIWLKAAAASNPVNFVVCNTTMNSPSEVHMNCFQWPAAKDPNSAKIAMDLNMPPDCLQDSEVTEQNVETVNGVKKIEESKDTLLMPRKKLDYGNSPNEDKEDLSQACSTSVSHAGTKRLKTVDCSGDEKNTQSNQKAGMVNVSADTMADTKLPGLGNQIDLNSCIIEGESLPSVSVPAIIVKNVVETDLEAPVSPENQECSPPRGESEENQLEMEDRDRKDELVTMAAQAIISISTPSFGLLVENTVSHASDGSSSDSLHWFAGIVSSFADGDGGDQDQHKLSSDHESDYFEAMTMEFTEAELEECFKRNDLKQEETDPPSPTKQLKRATRSRRGRQRKGFQTEVLPSLATLSRHEVTEDVQTILGLMEAAGIPTESMAGRRSAGRCLRARRRSGNSFNDWMDNVITACSELKQQSNGMELAAEERSLEGWGKINRRRRGPRMPTSNPLQIFS